MPNPYRVPNPYSKPKFWTRMKVGAVAGILGLVMGAAVAADPESEDPEPRVVEKIVEVPAEPAADDSSTRVTELEGELSEARAQQTQTLKRVRQQGRTDLSRAVRAARAEERRKARRQLRRAVNAAIQDSTPPPSSVEPAATTDPQFSYCYEANDAGYGPYVAGSDPEYDWYDDRDGDGIVCET